DSGTTPQVWAANVDETTLPATFSSASTASTLRNPSGTSWTQIPGAARDVGIGPDSSCTITVIGTDSLAGGGGVQVRGGTMGFGIYTWSGGCTAVGSWSEIPGGGVAISVGTDGLPFVVNSSGQIYERLF